MAISDEALEQTEYYNDFRKRQDLFHLAGGTIARDGSLRYGLTTLRPRRKGAFEERDLKHLQVVLPHLARAARISSELNTSAHVLQSFVTLKIGLILLDRRGRVVQANAPAERIFNQNDGLSLSAQGQVVSRKENDFLSA